MDYDQGGSYGGGSGGMGQLRSGSLHSNGQMNRTEFGAPSSGQFSMMGDVPLRASSTSPYAPPFGSGSVVMDRRTPSPMQPPAGGYMISPIHSPSMANNYPPRNQMQGSPYPLPTHHRSPSDGFLSSNVPGGAHPNDARMAYLHDEQGDYAYNGAGGAQVCRYFLTGNCMRGDRCNYLHTRAEPRHKEDKKRDKAKNRFPNPASAQGPKFNGRRGRGVAAPVADPAKRPAVDGTTSC